MNMIIDHSLCACILTALIKVMPVYVYIYFMVLCIDKLHVYISQFIKKLMGNISETKETNKVNTHAHYIEQTRVLASIIIIANG